MEKIIGNRNVLILDFDNTIWIWRRDFLDGPNRPNFLNLRMKDEFVYGDTYGFIPNKMINFINKAKSKNVEIFVLTVCDTSMEYINKYNLLKENFGFSYEQIIGISNSNLKLSIIENLIKNYKNKNFILVDDKIETLKECKKNLNIKVYNPIEIIGEDCIEFI